MTRIAALLAATLLVGAAVQAAGIDYDPTSAPKIDGAPVDVSVSFQILDFARFNPRDESFDVTGYLETRWLDPRLALKGKSGGNPIRRFAPGQVWTPHLYFANALELPKDHGLPEIDVDNDGKLVHGQIISGKFSSALYLQNFPFDHQALSIRIGAYSDRAETVLRARSDEITLSPEAFLTDWRILGVRAYETNERYLPQQEMNSFVVVETEIARRWTSYAWRFLLPMTLLVLVSWTVLWLDPSQMAPQATVAVGSLISLIGFNLAIDFAMPKVGYLTFIDRHALLGLVLVVAVLVETSMAHYFIVNGRAETGRRIQRNCRWLFPLVYGSGILMEFLWLASNGL